MIFCDFMPNTNAWHSLFAALIVKHCSNGGYKSLLNLSFIPYVKMSDIWHDCKTCIMQNREIHNPRVSVTSVKVHTVNLCI